MSYSKYYPSGWQDGESGATPITAAALNHMEDEIESLSDNPALLWKTGTYTGALTSENQLLTTNFSFPTRAGYSRAVARISCDTSNAVVTGYTVTTSNVLAFRTHRFSSSSLEVTVSFMALYVKDSLQW